MRKSNKSITYPLKDIDPAWWSQIQVKAEKEGITIKELIGELLEAWRACAPPPDRSVSFESHLWDMIERYARENDLNSVDLVRATMLAFLGWNDRRFERDLP